MPSQSAGCWHGCRKVGARRSWSEEEKELTPKEIKEEWEALKKRVAYLEAELLKRDAKIKELEGK